MNYPLPTYLFELRQRAFLKENQITEESVIVAGIGIINPSKRDALPIIADELLRMNGISTSIVFAIIGDNIDISVRSSDITLDISKFVQDVFGNGGGKQGAGRAIIPLGFFSMNGSDEINNDIWEVAKKMVISKSISNVKGE
jgi:nanoRNase/pAp phosphatase (c-di-AMP/oligoRNAs hydrolase)